MLDIFDILNTEKSRINFIKGLIYISKAEEIAIGSNAVEEEELTALNSAMNTLQIPENERTKLENLISSNEIKIDIEFENSTQSRLLIREALQICYIEGCYGDEEKDMIYKFGKKLGINSNQIEKIEKWVLEGIKWSEFGEKLVIGEVK